MRNILMVVFLAGISGNAMSEWVTVSSDDTKTTYADPATTVEKGHIVELWGLFDFKTVHTSDAGKSYKSLKFRDEFDCAEKQKRNLYISVHAENMAGGEMISSYSDPSKWQAVAGLSESLWKIACTNK